VASGKGADVSAGDRIRAEFSDLGTVSVEFT
jgi:hypothetical protein